MFFCEIHTEACPDMREVTGSSNCWMSTTISPRCRVLADTGWGGKHMRRELSELFGLFYNQDRQLRLGP